ncbi:MAG: transglycosylase SLT domain-containing protein [Candidatus Eremiobacteraeota bacterium]|nr:transglycosylase SLT domain-containing protein [Candidatus Eremiobacteraeota bacterium]
MTLSIAYAREIHAAANRHQLDPRLLEAVAAQETGGPGSNSGRNIVGDGGHGKGIFQIDDRYHAFARTPEAMQPAKNAEYAAAMIAGLLERYGSVHKALSAYNAGDPNASGTKTDWQDGERLGYADSVLRHYRILAAQTPAASLVSDARAESLHEQAASTQLASVASAQLPITLGAPPPFEAVRSFRALAGLDESGRTSHTDPYAGLIDADPADAPNGVFDGF